MNIDVCGSKFKPALGDGLPFMETRAGHLTTMIMIAQLIE